MNKVYINQIILIYFLGIHTRNPPATIRAHQEATRITKLWLIPDGLWSFHILQKAVIKTDEDQTELKGSPTPE